VQQGATVSERERHARIELAGLYRLIEHLGWGEGIYNHIALRVPGEPQHFLIKRHELAYEEVTASNLVKVPSDAEIGEADGVNGVGYHTHAPIMRARQDVQCSLHLHTVPIMALAALKDGVRMLNVQSLPFYDNVAAMAFGGTGLTRAEDDQMIACLGHRKVLLMRNHGAVITGRSAEDAFATALRFMAACRVQLEVAATGLEADALPEVVCARFAAQLQAHDAGRGDADWPAWLRRMDRLDLSYKD
jgi:ribulose-5-phosphate 4-epimerase/fuculose-1-phosphate aldolase